MGRRIRIARESGEVFELLGSVRRGARESVRCTVSESGEIRLKHAGRNGGNVSIRNKTLAGIQRYGVAASVTSNQCLFRVASVRIYIYHLPLYIHLRSTGSRYRLEIIFFQPKNFI